MKKTSSYKEALFDSLRNDTDEAEAYLNAALEDSPEAFLKALGNVAQANQMSKIPDLVCRNILVFCSFAPVFLIQYRRSRRLGIQVQKSES